MVDKKDLKIQRKNTHKLYCKQSKIRKNQNHNNLYNKYKD